MEGQRGEREGLEESLAKEMWLSWWSACRSMQKVLGLIPITP